MERLLYFRSMNYEEQSEFYRKEAERHGKLAEHFRKEGERVQKFAIVVLGMLVVLMTICALLLHPIKEKIPLPIGEQFPIQNPAS